MQPKRTGRGQGTGKGRSTRLTEEVHTKIVNAVRNGNYLETAAAFAGISKQTLHMWLNRGAVANPTRADKVYVEFRDAIERAQAEAEIRDVLTISRAAQEGIWQAAAWRLTRKNRERWAEQPKSTTVQASVGGIPVPASEDGKPAEITFTLKIAESAEAQAREDEEVAGTILP